MSPRSLLDFFFPRTSFYACRTSFLKAFNNSGSSVLPSSYIFKPCSCSVFIQLSHPSYDLFLFYNHFWNLFVQIYDHQLAIKFPWNHFFIPHILSLFLSQKYKINFCFALTSTIDYLPFFLLIQSRTGICHSQFFFITALQQFSSFRTFFPNVIPPIHAFKAVGAFSDMAIEVY